MRKKILRKLRWQKGLARKAMVLGVILLAVVSLAGAMAVTGAVPTEGAAVVTSDPALIAVEPRLTPITPAGGHTIPGHEDVVRFDDENGQLVFDFTEGSRGGFQPNSRYNYDLLFRVINKLDKDVFVWVDTEGLDYMSIGALDEEAQAEEVIWPDRTKERQITAGDFIWVSVHFEIPADAKIMDFMGQIIIGARADGGDDADNGGDKDDGHGLDAAPPVDDVPEGLFVARRPGHMPLVKGAVRLETPQDEFTVDLTCDPATLAAAGAKGLEPRVYIWNERFEKWVALASYPQDDGTVRAVNDGGYTGWTAVFAVRQPHFVDLAPNAWYEPVFNRASGLALLEGAPVDPVGPPTGDRLARPHAEMTRAEFVAMVTRAMGLVVEDEQRMYSLLRPVPEDEVTDVLRKRYLDAHAIPGWCRSAIASAFNSGLVDGVDGMDSSFAPATPISRVQAGVIISNALTRVSGYDFRAVAGEDELPSWARVRLAQGVLTPDAEGDLRPGDPLTRAEAYTLFLRLLRQLGW